MSGAILALAMFPERHVYELPVTQNTDLQKVALEYRLSHNSIHSDTRTAHKFPALYISVCRDPFAQQTLLSKCRQNHYVETQKSIRTLACRQ